MNDGSIIQGVHQMSDADRLKTEYNNNDKEVYGRVFQIRGYSTIISTPPLKHCVTT
jgi:hypothetical protein